METTFGTSLKDWRDRRQMSQMALGLAANVSARHISFLETGRARPSRSMVILLSESLSVPRAVRNTLLNAAGYSPSYARRDLEGADMTPVRAAIDWTLERHDPFPAFALDAHWSLVSLNKCAERLLGAAGLQAGDSLLDAFVADDRLPTMIDNWPEVARHMSSRLRTESAYLGGDDVLDRAAHILSKAQGDPPEANGILPAVTAVRYRPGDVILSFFSTIAQFGTAEDIALADMKIEFLFPADEITREYLLSAAA